MNSKTLHFCAGLPRTGSTVLMGILQQNPQIFTTGTCALPDLLYQYVLVKSRFRESFQAMSSEQADDAMYGLVHGAAQGWFNGLTNKPIVISKNRAWANVYHIFPNSKILVCVRDIRDIVESFDRVNSKIKALHSFGESESLYPSMTEEEKYNYFFKEINAFSAGLYNQLPRFMEVFVKQRDRVKFIRYEDLLQEPEYMLNEIYTFLGISSYQHDLNNIQQTELFEHDNAYFREKTDHKIASVITKFTEPTRTFSKAFQNRIINEHKWFYDGFYPEVKNV